MESHARLAIAGSHLARRLLTETSYHLVASGGDHVALARSLSHNNAIYALLGTMDVFDEELCLIDQLMRIIFVDT